MATYKFEAEFRFGKYYADLRKATDPKPDLTKGPALASPGDIVEHLYNLIEKGGLKESNDSIIWRGIGYSDFDTLAELVKRATY